jgi:Cytochrome c554 and c-prime
VTCAGLRWVAAVVSLLCQPLASAATPAPDVHLGVASCATGVCHGKVTPQKDRDVALNEYRVWSAEDRHSRAYQTLLSAQSKAIAQKLGIPSAQTSDLCLNCHADNVSQSLRGPKFQLSDGVQCEACHGGAGRWIESHAEPTATHADNVKNGMYPTEQPLPRAERCLSCHLGSDDRFATHRIMGAGHPRLSFELDAFSTNQPAHYTVDADYVRRKGTIDGFNLWLTGQLVNAKRFVTLASGHWLRGNTPMYPELAFYDCHACHHPMSDMRWSARVAGPGIAPGSLRLQTDHLLVLRAASEVLDAAGASALAQSTNGFVRAGQKSDDAVRQAGQPLLGWLTQREQDWASRSFARAQVVDVRRSLVRAAAEGRMGDFAAAEQTFLGVESLSINLGDAGRLRSALDAWFKTVEDAAKFNPDRFAASAKALQAAL